MLRLKPRIHLMKKESGKMKNADRTRLKRTLTALLLMFVLSFSTAFAGTEDPAPADPSAGGATQVQTETVDPPAVEEPQTQPEAEPQTEEQAAPEAAPAPAPPKGRIIKKGKYYYYKQPNGKIRKKAGFVKVDGKKYYVRKGGKIRTRKTFKVKKKYYRANKKGEIKTGVYKWNGKYSYSNADGVVKKKAGFVTWKGNRYYVQKGGTIITNDCFTVKNIPYAADEKGRVTKIPIPESNGNPVVDVAKAQVGIMTGKKYWVWYFKTRFRDTDRTPWCGTFVAWCFNEAGVYDKVKGILKYGNLGYVPSYSKYASGKGKWVKISDAQGGDIIVFGRNVHVGLVEGVYGDYIITIEGNSGPTALIKGKPGAVVRKVRKKNSKAIKGIIHVMD